MRSIRGFTTAVDVATPEHFVTLAPSASDHTEGAAAFAEADGVATALGQGESVSLTFPAVAASHGSMRSFFLDLRAAYTPPTGAWSARLHPAGPQVPRQFALLQNRPNPLSGGTTVRFDVPRRAAVAIEVFDALGRRVKTLVSQTLEPGAHAYEWDARDDRGRLLGPGVYLYRMVAGEFRAQRRLVLLAR